MGMSNFTNFLHGVTIRGVPILQTNPGKIIWVNNSSVLPDGGIAGSDTNKGTYLKPFSTIDYAIGQCVASRGDIICVMPGHVETLSTANGIDLDIAGVAVVGLGQGSLRPVINITATAGFVRFNAASCSLVNVLIKGGIDAITKAIQVNASDCYLELNYRDVTGQITDCVVTTASADRLKIHVNEYEGAVAAGTNAAIAIVGGDLIEITGNRMRGNFAVGGIDVRTTATTNLFVHDFKNFRTENAADIFLVDTITASTGQVGPNVNLMLKDNAANITEAITGATLIVQDPVYVCNLAGEKGMLINWTESTDA